MVPTPTEDGLQCTNGMSNSRRNAQFANAGTATSAGINMTRSGGRVLMFGIITAKEGALPFYDLYFKELSLINARVAKSEDYPGAIGLVQRGLVKLEPLVSDVLPLGELKTAIGMLGSDGGGQRMKIILDHGIH